LKECDSDTQLFQFFSNAAIFPVLHTSSAAVTGLSVWESFGTELQPIAMQQ
jgi:hypothetical protein